MTVHFDTIEKSTEFQGQVASAGAHRGADTYRSIGKRGLDLAIIMLALPVVLPAVALFTLLLLMCGHRPFYKQARIGRDGHVFEIWKFRTMVEDAESVLTEYLDQNPDARAEWDVHQKLKNDPRVTAIGRILRKTSMDELPQLWNVAAGTMSLVGPRPMLPEQQALYTSHSYYRMRPGITGFWQISDRNECAFHARATFDTLYEREQSFLTDIGVLVRTVLVVFRGTGY